MRAAAGQTLKAHQCPNARMIGILQHHTAQRSANQRRDHTKQITRKQHNPFGVLFQKRLHRLRATFLSLSFIEKKNI
jgi:hypothetical protein